MTKAKLATGTGLRKVSLQQLLEVRDAIARHQAAPQLFTKNSRHFVAMKPSSINLIKRFIVANKIDEADERARAFAECDTCPPWQ